MPTKHQSLPLLSPLLTSWFLLAGILGTYPQAKPLSTHRGQKDDNNNPCSIASCSSMMMGGFQPSLNPLPMSSPHPPPYRLRWGQPAPHLASKLSVTGLGCLLLLCFCLESQPGSCWRMEAFSSAQPPPSTQARAIVAGVVRTTAARDTVIFSNETQVTPPYKTPTPPGNAHIPPCGLWVELKASHHPSLALPLSHLSVLYVGCNVCTQHSVFVPEEPSHEKQLRPETACFPSQVLMH